MFYKNSYLEKMADVLQKKDVENLISQLTDENEIVRMFEYDADYIIQNYKDGSITYEEAKKNFDMLKAYVLTQLKYHFEKVKELAKHFEVEYRCEGISDEVVERIVEMLAEHENSLG